MSELKEIITKFSESGWDVIDAPSKRWLANSESADATKELLSALKQANDSCGNCGCEFDPLYKKALVLLAA